MKLKNGDPIEFICDRDFLHPEPGWSGRMSSHYRMGDGPWWKPGIYLEKAPDFGRSYHRVKAATGGEHVIPARRLRLQVKP